ncbi:MAG: microcin ABC transporter ATP-binding protein [Alphaproteobacteria bacterium]|nr:microcin ABC transporter ATP-binding protein [Alphaproteobacteria bacterium]MAS48539.1 microcin ABC transporter ATP-binding protein [Alphaproteobacteria bacterium]MAX96203.1 microcin ABC transporter ATP-binding protein [Alphaproteobacteria bacterium]MBN54759.1 microcin ABC transporter ATP-binding protein [Alphaproteobacteria bacterium]OUT39192.1 MAG: microcin ABC transporter ATP-binding protein [Micavibrio sp. TMED2]|tara:strand:- start:1170 stop:2825 length:1656 start_codon:yes stop_codon:yes gene_type:complete
MSDVLTQPEATTGSAEPLLSIRDLAVSFGGTEAVRDVDFDIYPGETLALVGESGSGKSVTALSVLQLLPYNVASHPRGSIKYRGTEIIGAPQRTLRGVRGNQISMIFQEPMTSLNPLHTIEKQISEALFVHKGMGRAAARARVIELLELVGLPRLTKRLNAYPHELSGGQRQRVMIAMALANEPDLLIADEPTTALDVTVQAQVLNLLKDLQSRLGMAILLITHDLGVVRKVADRVCVMNQGEIVEAGKLPETFDAPQHAYTKRLLDAEPKGQALAFNGDAAPIMAADNLKVYFPIRKGVIKRTVDHVKAVDGIPVSVRPGETVGVVGESGSGKTTLGQGLLRLVDSEGAIRFQGKDIQGLSRSEIRPLRREMQVVFQDPYGSLSPRMSVSEIIAEGVRLHKLAGSKAEEDRMIAEVLQEVGLDPETRHRYPHEFSGGQRQRISIARAMILKPKFVVLDEPTSALDMSVQAQIVDLLRDLQAKHDLAYLFISHDLKVVRALSNSVIVMKDGKVVEQGPVDQIFDAPQTDYTKALIKAAFDIEAVHEEAVSS